MRVLFKFILFVFLLFSCQPEVKRESNHDPEIISVTSSPAEIIQGNTSVLKCIASDEDKDNLSYSWSCTSGQLVSNSSSEVSWRAVNCSVATHTLTVVVTDGKGGSVTGSVTVNVIQNTTGTGNAPVISQIKAEPNLILPGEKSTLTCIATDADGDTLTYQWDNNSIGSLNVNNISVVEWTAPTQPGEYTINVIVSDGKGNEKEGSVKVTVQSTPIVNNSTDVIIDSLIIKTDDGNNDLKANKGETLQFTLAVKNNKTTAIEGVNLKISSTSSFVTILTDTDSGFYTVNSNQIDYGTNPGFKIKISTAATPNTKIYFDAVISSTSGSWSSTFYINVYGVSSSVVYSSYSIAQEVSGNMDNIINP